MDFTKVYNQYGDKIYRVCLGFLNDADLAKDVMQETFIAVWKNSDSFRQKSAISTWIYRIATNKCLRMLEIQKKRGEVELANQADENNSGEEGMEKVVLLRKLIAGLAEIDRIIISLYMERVPQEEIAEVTGLTHANIRVKTHRIKLQLLKKFKEHGEF